MKIIFGGTIMKKVISGLLCSLLLTGCGSVETTSTQVEVEEENTVLLDENSLDISLKTSEYNKENNSLLVEYETGLPEDTVVEIILNLGHPDSWAEEYDPLYEYASRMSYKQVETTVKDGIISYTFDDDHFNSQPLPSSMIYTIVKVPVTEEKNSIIGDEIFKEEDFDEMYPNSTTFWFSDPVYEDGYEFRFEDSFEMKSAHTIEEVYAYYKKDTIPYKELEKNPFKYEGTPISFTGEVLQIQEEDAKDEQGLSTTNTVLRLAINGDPNQVLYVTSQRYSGMEGVYNEDTITVYGEVTGSTTYESVAGYQITIPSMDAIIYHK